MPRISIDNYNTVASWNGSQDLFIVEQPDGTKVATPALLKQFIEAGDFEATGEVKDGHGNILNTMATTLSNKADTSYVDTQIAGRCEGGNYSTSNTSLTAQMNAIKTSGKSGVYSFYCSSANEDFSTIGYCSALGFLGYGNVSNLIAVNSQTGDLWTNGNTSQNPDGWIGWKNLSPISLIKKLSLTNGVATDIDIGKGDGVFILLVAQSAGLDMVGIYIIKVTNYSSGTVVKTLLAPQSYAPTVTATSRTSNTNGKITVTAQANHNAALYKFNIF